MAGGILFLIEYSPHYSEERGDDWLLRLRTRFSSTRYGLSKLSWPCDKPFKEAINTLEDSTTCFKRLVEYMKRRSSLDMCPRSKEIQAETEMLLTCRKTQRTHTTKAIGHTIKIKIIIQMMDMQI
jgi:hypothetical protein